MEEEEVWTVLRRLVAEIAMGGYENEAGSLTMNLAYQDAVSLLALRDG